MKNEDILMNQIFMPLYQMHRDKNYVKDKTGVKMVELIAPRIELNPTQPLLDFGVRKTPKKYAEAEVKWYLSQDLSVKEIGKDAQIWLQVADKNGNVNSNYGWCIYSPENGYQYDFAVKQLQDDPESRRSCMIYNRPTMQTDYNKDGMNDFMCTFATQHFIRNKELIYVVMMRSQDAIYGFFNDFYWHCFVYDNMYSQLQKKYINLQVGKMIWIANSFHVYERHFDMLEKIAKTTQNVPVE